MFDTVIAIGDSTGATGDQNRALRVSDRIR
jgi:hypothetical protein